MRPRRRRQPNTDGQGNLLAAVLLILAIILFLAWNEWRPTLPPKEDQTTNQR